ncbi:MAG: DMT family transporter [Spongiibacteraceae bacterium]
MLPQLTYFLVIIIWATTPLAIKLGGESFVPLAGLSLRIALAFLVGSAICTIGGYAGLNIKRHWKLYAVASIGLFPNMALVYMAATYIPSGLIALLFGLTPFYSALLSQLLLGEGDLPARKLVAITIAVVGLGLIFADRSSLNAGSTPGILLMLISNLLFSGSALWVKRINRTLSVGPMEQALGAMVFSLPGLFITWFAVVGFEPVSVTPASLVSLLYLAFCGSLLGFVAYYYILNQFTAETVSLIPLITPVLAMILGVVVVDEQVTLAMIAGAVLIISALIIHQRLWHVLRLRYPCRNKQGDQI